MDANTLYIIASTVGSVFLAVIKLQSYINEKFNKLDRRVVRLETKLNIQDTET